MVERHGKGKLLSSWQPGSREREEEGSVDKIGPSKEHTQ
jgi:hypothetical protein